MIVHLGGIVVANQQREFRNQLDALTKHIRKADIIRLVVIGIKHQHAARECVHNILAGLFHNHVTQEIGGNAAVTSEQFSELGKRVSIGQLSEKQQVGRLLKAEAISGNEAGDQVFDIDAAVEQFAGTGNERAVRQLLFRGDFGNLGQAGQNTVAVEVAQSALDAVGIVQRGVDPTVFTHFFRQRK